MPVATVKVQEQTLQAFLNWLRIASHFLWHSSRGRNAEGNLQSAWSEPTRSREKVWDQRGGQHFRGYVVSTQYCYGPLFFPLLFKENIAGKKKTLYIVTPLKEPSLFGRPDERWRWEKECMLEVRMIMAVCLLELDRPGLRVYALPLLRIIKMILKVLHATQSVS